MGWTKDQEKAIYTDTGSGNLLVSAAAGSGKTAVLVERVLQKILSGKSTVDRLLIVTFTEAAASEMRQKIIKRLSGYLTDPHAGNEKKNLMKEQLRLAQTADIMTIDGFCSKVVSNNFHILGISPDIRVCDDAMSKLLEKEAMDSLFNRIYKSDDEEIKLRFERLAEFYAKDYNNDGLSDIILSIYHFTEPFADPEKWIQNAVSDFDMPFSERVISRYYEDCIKKDGGIILDAADLSQPCEDSLEDNQLKQQLEDLQWMFSEFSREFSELKNKKNLYQFSDIERFTYLLFRDNDTVRNEYSAKYDEILIDEYQDTNMLQDTIFELISHKNIFMVGDLKQSIYRFRKGDPYIFKDKANLYSCDDTPDNRVTLSQNFRSRKQILNSVNDIFGKIMSETAGDVDYSGDELIVRDDSYETYPPSDADLKSELHFLAISKDSGIDRTVYEARYTAAIIRKLLDDNTPVYDKNLDCMRPIQKKDIVILESSVKYNAEIITDELSRLGIASYVDKSSFFDRREIILMLSLISVIGNSHNDIPLISVMRSPIGGFSDEDLALIRVHAKSCGYFIDAVASYAKDGENDRLRAHCGGFLSNIRRWRGYTRKKTVAQLIWAIYEETCFYDMMGAIEEGEEAQTNLRLLYERAKQYESAGFKGLFNFINYINSLSESKNDLEGAKMVSENHDVVRIMTIHKSKGLEFPYVFVLGAGRSFPTVVDFSPVRMHKLLGFGLPLIHYDKHYARKTYAYNLINTVNKAENMSERMRLLYVALTRPREKLYVIAAQNNNKNLSADDYTIMWSDMLNDNKMPPLTALHAKGFFDWLCPAAYASPDTWKFVFRDVTSMPECAFSEEAESETYEDSDMLRESVYRILDYRYPYADSNTIPSRTSVTQLKELANTDTEYEPDSRRLSGIDDIAELMFSPLHSRPKFLLESTEKPANEIGTLYHLVMSEIDINAIAENGPDYAINELARLVAEDIISENDMSYINPDKIVSFFETDLARRMSESKNIHRESPFQINILASEYDPSLTDASANEKIILQGIIDCFFEEDDGFILFDYKTDKVRNGSEEIRAKYQKQLELYSRAIEELTGKPVREAYLYLFDTNEVI